MTTAASKGTPSLDPKMLHVLRHSLGIGEQGRGAIYRNHFVAGAGSADHETCLHLVSLGYMHHRANWSSALTGGDDLFVVSDEGKRAARATAEADPKRTRAQRRYARFLDSDSGLSFGEWLRQGGAR